MTDTPAGWYDDPENAAQHRYWDGSQWTEHRAAKAAPPPPPGAANDAWSLIPNSFQLLGKAWRELVVLLFPVWIIIGLGAVLILLMVDSAVEPGMSSIIDRVSEPGFDPVNNTADEAFVESIEFSLGTAEVSIIAATALVVFFVVLLAYVALITHLTAVRAGRSPTVGDTIRFSLGRLPRTVGIGLLWFLGYLVVLVVLFAVFIGAVLVSPLLLIALVPALMGLGIYVFPIPFIAWVALATGPTDDPPLRRGISIVRGRWGQVALRVLVLSLLLIGFSVSTNFVTGPISAASIWAGLLASVLLQSAYYALSAAGCVMLYHWADGPVDPALS